MMPSLSIKVTPKEIEAMLDLIHTVRASLKYDLAVPVQGIDEDPDLANAWIAGLNEELDHDCDHLLMLLEDKKFGTSEMTLNISNAEAILRSASAIRLRLQQTLLRRIPDGNLETDNVVQESLSSEEQRAYNIYTFLANLQQLIIAEIDPAMDEYTDF